MRVLLDTHMLGRRDTGNERYWKNLALALNHNKQEVKIIGYNLWPRNGLFRLALGLTAATNKGRADINHVQNFAPLIKTVPLVTTVHDLCSKTHMSLFGWKTRIAFRFFFKRTLNLSDAIICVSKETKNQLLKFYKINPKKIFVVYEAADDCFCFIKDKDSIKRSLLKRFDIKGKYFLVVGAIESRKLPYEIINSFNRIRDKIPGVKLIFAGPNKLGIKSALNIRTLGYVTDEELNLLYNGSLALVHLSLCEGFGLPIVEAMATKTPVICSNLAVFREITGNQAMFIKHSQNLSKTMESIAKNDRLRNKYGELGYKRSCQFSWQKTAQKTIEIYKKLSNE
ncbi:glycosyltransferase family 4 protein [Patescibacteria group bacterium]|nr:glycosyltransferase family 4 protein [Patescibacteria group bacterium]